MIKIEIKHKNKIIYVTYYSRQNNHVVNTQVRQTTCLFTNKWRLFLTVIEVTLCT